MKLILIIFCRENIEDKEESKVPISKPPVASQVLDGHGVCLPINLRPLVELNNLRLSGTMHSILLRGLSARNSKYNICQDVVQQLEGVCYHLPDQDKVVFHGQAMQWSYSHGNSTGSFNWVPCLQVLHYENP